MDFKDRWVLIRKVVFEEKHFFLRKSMYKSWEVKKVVIRNL